MFILVATACQSERCVCGLEVRPTRSQTCCCSPGRKPKRKDCIKKKMKIKMKMQMLRHAIRGAPTRRWLFPTWPEARPSETTVTPFWWRPDCEVIFRGSPAVGGRREDQCGLRLSQTRRISHVSTLIVRANVAQVLHQLENCVLSLRFLRTKCRHEAVQISLNIVIIACRHIIRSAC